MEICGGRCWVSLRVVVGAGGAPARWRGRFRNDDGGSVVAVCFEGCYGGMCWPRERPATHAAAGAAARGVRGGLGDFFTCSGATRRGLMRFKGFWFFECCEGQCPSRAVASRQRSRNSGGMPRLAAEIPDIFIPLARNENSGMTMGGSVVAVCFEGFARGRS